MDQKFLEYVVQQTGAIGLAALTLYFLQRLQAEATKRADEYAKSLSAINERLYSLLADTIRTIALFQGQLSSVEDELRELRRTAGGDHAKRSSGD